MPVLEKRVIIKNREFVTKSKCFYYNPLSAKGRRKARKFSTGESKLARNKRAAYLKRKYEIYENFDKGDLWITLTYNQDSVPELPEEAHRNMTRVLAKIQRKLKKSNIPFVWYLKTESGERQRVHHHLLIKNNFDVVKEIYSHWKKFGKVKDFSEVYDIDSGKLIKYILDGGQHKDLNFEKYSHSRNLRQPEVHTRVIPVNNFRANPKPPVRNDGFVYRIEGLYNGFPDLDGFIYQEYVIVKEEQKE